MLSISAATFAANAAKEAVATTYNMNINMDALAHSLGMNQDQQDAVSDVQKSFKAGLMNAASYEEGEIRKEQVQKVINKHLEYMSLILSRDQYRDYLALLNTTINNRGLNK